MTIATATSSANRRGSCVVRLFLLGESINGGHLSFDGNDRVVGNTDDLVARAPGRNGMHTDLIRAGRLCDSNRTLAVSYDDEWSQNAGNVQCLWLGQRQVHGRHDLVVHSDDGHRASCAVHNLSLIHISEPTRPY